MRSQILLSIALAGALLLVSQNNGVVDLGYPEAAFFSEFDFESFARRQSDRFRVGAHGFHSDKPKWTATSRLDPLGS